MNESVKQLKERIIMLEKENQMLKEELYKRGITFITNEKHLDRNQKIAVFMDYFKPRLDVYEKRYFSNKQNKFGWTLVCFNEFKDGCRKGRITNACRNCPIKSLAPLTKEVIIDHFKGTNKNLGIGIYPLLKDNTCYFLALDFDDDSWFEDMYSVFKVAVRYGLEPVMERSASGAGGHLWFFFSTNIKASLARRFGEFLLQETMKQNTRITFKSFDRMFPNQDYLPEGGFGNQIALPLRYSSYAQGNTTFINELQQPYFNPIEYLTTRKKITQEEVEKILEYNTENDYFFDSDQMCFNLNVSQKYVDRIVGKEYTALMIEKKNLNSLTYNTIKRISSMYNPAYFELQRLHKPIYYKNTPRILSYYEEDDTYIYLPRGTKDKLMSVLRDTHFEIEEVTSEGHEIDVDFKGELKPEQKPAVEKMIKYNMGVLKAVPGFGKTVIGIYLISHFKVSTLVIVPTKPIQDQWLESINEFLEYPKASKKKDEFVCVYNGNKKRVNKNIDIATASSLSRMENLDDFLNSYGMVIVDECHRAASDTFTHILRNASSKRIYGLSATPKREDGLEKVIYMFCGLKRFERSSLQMKGSYGFSQVLIPRITNSVVLDRKAGFVEICNELIKDMARNQLIFKDILNEYNQGSKIIVLSERKEHLSLIEDMLNKAALRVYLMTGEQKKSQRDLIMKQIKELDSHESYVLLATSTLLGEGFDLPELRTLFLTMPISGESRLTQYTGRIQRNDEGKDVVKVYDYVDVQIPMMQTMFHKRLKHYQNIGYGIYEQTKESSIQQVLFENSEVKSQLIEDIENAKKEIVIFTTTLLLSKIKDYFTLLSNTYSKGIKIYFVLSNKLKNKQLELKHISGIGASFQFIEHNKHFVVIDRQTVWNLDFDIFGYNKADGYGIRISDNQLIDDILKEISITSKRDDLTLF